MHPYLFQFGRIVLPTYGFLVAAGTILCLLVCVRNARLLALDTDKVWGVALLAIVTWLLSSKILLVLLYWRQYGPRALSVGMDGTRNIAVSLTSTAAVVAVAVAYSLRRKLPLLRAADAAAPSLALGSAFVSIACLEAGCDYGTPTKLPWAIIFRSPGRLTGIPSGAPIGVPLHPTQVYASLIAFVMFVVLLVLLHAPHRDGEVLGAWLFLAGLTNAVLEPLRGDPTNGLLTVLLSAGMVLAGACLWLRRSPAAQVPVRG